MEPLVYAMIEYVCVQKSYMWEPIWPKNTLVRPSKTSHTITSERPKRQSASHLPSVWLVSSGRDSTKTRQSITNDMNRAVSATHKKNTIIEARPRSRDVSCVQLKWSVSSERLWSSKTNDTCWNICYLLGTTGSAPVYTCSHFFGHIEPTLVEDEDQRNRNTVHICRTLYFCCTSSIKVLHSHKECSVTLSETSSKYRACTCNWCLHMQMCIYIYMYICYICRVAKYTRILFRIMRNCEYFNNFPLYIFTWKFIFQFIRIGTTKNTLWFFITNLFIYFE